MQLSKKYKSFIVTLFLIGIAVIYIIPLVIIFTNSFMTQGEISRNYGTNFTVFDHERINDIHYASYNLIPERFSFEQYNKLLFQTPMYLSLFFNSVKLTIPIVLMQVTTGAMAAYCFMVWEWKYKEVLFCVYIIVMILPFQATLVSNYIMVDKLGILDSHLSVTLPWGFSPFAVFIMRQNMKEIPNDIWGAAQIDGATHLQRFIHIAVPMSKSGIASLAILSFTDCWGMVEQPMIFIRDSAKEPLSVFLSRIGQDNMGLIFAASFFYMIPVVWIFLYGQDYFEQGIQLSAFK